MQVTYFNERPLEREIKVVGKRATVFIRENIEQIEEGWKADEYTAIVNSLKFQITDSFVEKVKESDYKKAAKEVRAIRDRLLNESDKMMCLDRVGLDTSSTTKFLASLKNIFQNGYAEYRQALRDLTEQEGFPYNVIFPDKPE